MFLDNIVKNISDILYTYGPTYSCFQEVIEDLFQHLAGEHAVWLECSPPPQMISVIRLQFASQSFSV